ncbi:unnamed protein product, partial [Heterosigma akashiwo]
LGKYAVWLRGLPWDTSKDAIKEWLGAGVKVTRVTLRPGNSGEALAEVASRGDQDAARARDRAHMGK